MKIYASKYRINNHGYDSAGQYFGFDKWSQLYQVRIETLDYPLGFSEIVRVDDYGYTNNMLRNEAIKKALPGLKKRLDRAENRH